MASLPENYQTSSGEEDDMVSVKEGHPSEHKSDVHSVSVAEDDPPEQESDVHSVSVEKDDPPEQKSDVHPVSVEEGYPSEQKIDLHAVSVEKDDPLKQKSDVHPVSVEEDDPSEQESDVEEVTSDSSGVSRAERHASQDDRNTEEDHSSAEQGSKSFSQNTLEVNPEIKLCREHLIHLYNSMISDSMISDQIEHIEHLKPCSPVTVAILDMSIKEDHQAFKLQEKPIVKFSLGKRISDINHGTACAAIVGGCPYKARYQGNIEDTPFKNFFKKCKKEEKRQKSCYETCRLFDNGVAPFVRLRFGEIGENSISLVEAINWAANSDADIITISVINEVFSEALADAIYNAELKGKIIVCCASNEGSSDKSTIKYPAKLGNVICVGSHDNTHDVSRFSSVGREVDFLGPGENVWTASTATDQSISQQTGTSMAAPFIAGVCALVLAYADLIGKKHDKRDLRTRVCHTQVMKKILRSFATHPGFHDQRHGFGSLKPSSLFSLSEKHFIDMVDGICHESPSPACSPRLCVRASAIIDFVAKVTGREPWDNKVQEKAVSLLKDLEKDKTTVKCIEVWDMRLPRDWETKMVSLEIFNWDEATRNFKTSKEMVDSGEDRVLADHSYETPWVTYFKKLKNQVEHQTTIAIVGSACSNSIFVENAKQELQNCYKYVAINDSEPNTSDKILCIDHQFMCKFLYCDGYNPDVFEIIDVKTENLSCNRVDRAFQSQTYHILAEPKQHRQIIPIPVRETKGRIEAETMSRQIAWIIEVLGRSPKGNFNSPTVAGGLKRCTEALDIVVIPCAFETYCHHLFEEIANLSRRGVIVVVPAVISTKHRFSEMPYPACYGDVLVFGNCDEKGKASNLTAQGRELDFLMPASTPAEACVYGADLIAFILAKVEEIGGRDMRRAITNNCVMRDVLRQWCSSSPGMHDNANGYGVLDPRDLINFSQEDLKVVIEKATADSREPAKSRDGGTS